MSIFSKSTPSTPEPDPRRLHDGHDDEAGDLFVPVELRDIYANTPAPGHKAIEERMYELALDQAAGQGRARYESKDRSGKLVKNYPPTAMYHAEQVQIADRLVDENRDTLRALAIHQLTLAAALTAFDAQERRAGSREQFIRENTCPVCKQCDPAGNGLTEARDLMGRPAGGGYHLLQSCFRCFAIRQAKLAAEWTSDRLDDGRTRGEAVHAATVIRSITG